MNRRKLFIVLFSVATLTAVLALPAMAVSDDSTYIEGSLQATIDVTAPKTPSVDPWYLFTGENLTRYGDGSVVCNLDVDWYVDANSGESDGYMWSYSDSLNAPFEISPTGSEYVTASEGITYAGSGTGPTPLTLYCRQMVDSTDLPDTYSITIYFHGYFGY